MAATEEQNNNLKDHPLFRIEYEEEIPFDGYIEDKWDKIEDILGIKGDADNDNVDENQKRVNFIAGMGTGKNVLIY